MEPEEKAEKVEVEMQPVRLLFAPVWKRMLAYLIDILIVGLVFYLILIGVYRKEISLIVAQETLDNQLKMMRLFVDGHNLQVTIANFIIQGAYFVLGWMARGQTIGARILKIVVITMDKRKLSAFQGIVRYSLLYLSAMAFWIPLIFVVNPVYHQRIHDALSGSVVVEMPEVQAGDDENAGNAQNGEDPEGKS